MATKKIQIEVSVPVKEFGEGVLENYTPEAECMYVLKLRLKHCKEQLAKNVLEGTAFVLPNSDGEVLYEDGGHYNQHVADMMQECIDTCKFIREYKHPKLMYQQVCRHLYEDTNLASVDETPVSEIFRYASEALLLC